MNTRYCFCLLALTALTARAAGTTNFPNFHEVYDLLQSNGVSRSQLDEAAVEGLLDNLSGKARLVRDEPEATTNTAASPLARAVVLDGAYPYFRLSRIEAGAGKALEKAFADIVKTNKARVKGIILDLRFANGTDFSAAGALANCFLNTDQPILDWGADSYRATKKDDAISVPLAILVNAKTAGAAEAVAAVLRKADRGLVLGSETAGEASVYRTFDLSNGQKMRVATSPVKLSDGEAITNGLTPDIVIDATAADERIWLEDPFKDLHPNILPADGGATNVLNSMTNEAPERRFNEAELVREHREGGVIDDASILETGPTEPTPPAIMDPALARGLDLLKGLAVIQKGG